jgi:hypothetical protein
MLRTEERPEQLFGDFLVWMDEPENEIKEHTKKDAAPAAQAFLSLLRRDVRISDDPTVKTLRRNVNTQMKRAQAYEVIWPIQIYTQFVREGPDPSKEPWPILTGLAAANLVVFVPCRTIALIKMDPSKSRIRPADGSLIIPAQEKTDTGKGRTELVIRSAPEKWLSPKFYVDCLLNRAQSLGVYDALFCSEKGRKYKRSDSICKALKRLLHRMGVKGFTSYSFRHSIIQALIDAGLDEKEVNSYSGHSNNSSTVRKYYYHLDKAWASEMVRALSTDRIHLCRLAKRIIEKDGDEEE